MQQDPPDLPVSVLRRVIAPMTEAVIVIDHAGLVVAVNQSAVSLLDLLDERMALRPLAEYGELISAWRVGDQVIAPEQLQRTLAGEEIGQQRATVVTAAGVEHIVEFSTTPIRDEAGAVQLAMLVARDITQGVREAAYGGAVATTATRLTTELNVEHVLESAVDVIVEALGGQIVLGIWRLDNATQELRLRIHRGISDKTAARLGSLPLDCNSFICEAAHARRVIYTEDTRTQLPGHESDRRLIRDEGLISWIVSPLLATGRLSGTMGYGLRVPQRIYQQDVEAISSIGSLFATAISHAELYEQSERRRAELESERDTRARFTAAVAHDLAQPLTSIKGYARMLARSGRLNAQQQEFADLIGEQALRLERMRQDLSDTSQLATGRFSLASRAVDLVPLVERAVREARTRGANAVAAVPPKAPCTCDPDRVLAVLDNLLTNAQKFSPVGAEIRVELAARDADVLVRIEDQGVGIGEGHVERIFEPFTRLEAASAAQGSGLGLYIARAIVEQHGGEIWVESAGPGEGSTFSFTLPR